MLNVPQQQEIAPSTPTPATIYEESNSGEERLQSEDGCDQDENKSIS